MFFNKKIQLIFDKETDHILDGQSKICNWLYNQLLEYVNKDLNDKIFILLYNRNLRDLITPLKKVHPFLYTVHSSPLKNVAFRLKAAFDGYFKYNRGKPKFHSNKIKWFSLLYNEPNKGFKVNQNKVTIILGKDKDDKRLKVEGRLKENLKLKETDQIKTFNLTKEKGTFYGIFCIERETIEPKEIQSYIAIDPNHKNFFVGIDDKGKSIEFKKPIQSGHFDCEIDKVKSKRDQCKKYSKRWKRLNRTIDKLYHRRREQIKSMCYSISHDLARKYDMVVIGDYTPTIKTAKENNMHRSMLNQATIGKFRNILEWVLTKSGKHYKIIDERNTTKACCVCNHHKSKDPSIREFVCENCQTSINRDINSSVNIAKKANLLSGSDYVKWDLSQITYIAKWDYRKSKILFSGCVS